MNLWNRVVARTFLALGGLSLLGTAAQGATTTRVSVASDGTQSNGASAAQSLSADGRFVAFHSGADNLVPGDTNNGTDVFVHDRETGQTTRGSVASDGTQGNYDSWYPSISADGRFVAFESLASNLVPGDTNLAWDIFVHDRQTGQTTRASVASDGSQGNGWCYGASISADGRFVAFASYASNLVPGDTNGWRDVFVHDRQTGETTRVSVASDGTQGTHESYNPSISAAGRFVAFESHASNLVPGDTNDSTDVFVHDRQTGQTARVTVASDGTEGNSLSYSASLSADGQFVALQSYATNLVPGDTNLHPDIFVHDRQTGQTTRVSVASDGIQGGSDSEYPAVSADGRFVAFRSYASNLVPGDTNWTWDAFVHDRQTGQTTRVSVASDGTQQDFGEAGSRCAPSITGDGRFVAFWTSATNLVPGDTNLRSDVFVHDRGALAPAVTSFLISNGATTTASPAVTLDNTCTGSPTDYMASESPGFTGAAWAAYSTAPSFTLSSGYGMKTVYFKVKNEAGESSAVSDTIEYVPGVVTVSPVVPTQCPKVATQCPALATSCPPGTTTCPTTTTKCPSVTTKCPGVTTKCPAITTLCPPIATKCPPVTTKCPPVTTACPPITTLCPPITTKCPPVTTKCPPVTTTCPPITTLCPPIATKCPPVTTKCPPVTTQCPPITTLCPPITTKCPPATTVCPATTTQCPPANTKCPVVETSCPACP